MLLTFELEIRAGTKGISIKPHGTSYWTRTARLDVELDDGTPRSFFLKLTTSDRGKSMVEGETASMKAIDDLGLNVCPTPIVYGTYESDPSLHFFLCSFHNFTEDVPEAASFCERVTQMHLDSVSPTGQFGFHVTTHNGNLPQLNAWNPWWEDFLAKSFEKMLELEIAAQGPSKEIEELRGPLFAKAIPRLLRPLESEGRSITPSLVHGDLWHGNASTNIETGRPMVYDACCFYAHNEYGLGNWRPARNKFWKAYSEGYHRHYPRAEPIEDYDDRNLLCSMRFNLQAFALFLGNDAYRELLISELRTLAEKYPRGYELPLKLK